MISDHSVFSHFIGPINPRPTVDFEEFAEYEAGQMNMVDKYVARAVRSSGMTESIYSLFFGN
jgi:hypothetical protein